VHSVQEAAAQTGLTAHTLRYYERIGLVPFVDRNPSSGHRCYSDRDLQILEFLKRLRATGMSIQQMQRYVEMVVQGDTTIDERREMLYLHGARVREQMAELQITLERIDEKLARYEELGRKISSLMKEENK
jgi:DNA-binding transcriptional MerR regulator